MGVKRDEKEKENCFFKYKRSGFRKKKKSVRRENMSGSGNSQ